MLKQLQKLIVGLSAHGQKRQDQELVRKAQGLAAALVRKPESAGERLNALQAAYDFHAKEVSTWIEPQAILDGQSGPFDACDLRHWLALAERAGVPFVPAREIVSLSEDEMSLASGQVEVPDTPMSRGIRRHAANVPELAAAESPPAQDPIERQAQLEDIQERLYAAMDEVPEGYMVRSARCGSDELKALAGAGVAGHEVPEVRFDADLEVGPGWVRHGNRRQVRVNDHRTVMMSAQGPGGAVFLARPWLEAARYTVTEDPHRHGTVFAGKGIWPAEWRAFVEKGEVIGVAYYYAWAGEATPENAAIAIQVRELAQRVVDQAKVLSAVPRFLDIEMLRHGPKAAHPLVQKALEQFGRDDIACTLDFLEVKDEGLMLLEGGPGNTPFGGGHPCAFAGSGGPPKSGNKTITEGVAFRTMPNVLLGDPSTWQEGDRDGCILGWDEVHKLAAQYDPSSVTIPSP